MDERRSEDRKYLNYFSSVVDKDSGTLIGYLVDMTTGGMLMVGSYAFEPNTPLRLRIDLPEDIFDQPTLEVEALAVWCQPDGDPEMYRTGLRLRNTTPRDFLILGKLLSGYGGRF